MSGLLRICAIIMLICAAIAAIGLLQAPVLLVLLVPGIGVALCFWVMADVHEKHFPPDSPEAELGEADREARYQELLEYRARQRKPNKKYREPGRPAELGEPEEL